MTQFCLVLVLVVIYVHLPSQIQCYTFFITPHVFCVFFAIFVLCDILHFGVYGHVSSVKLNYVFCLPRPCVTLLQQLTFVFHELRVLWVLNVVLKIILRFVKFAH